MSKTLLFVYGTLKTGMPSHHLLKGQEFRGPAATVAQYRLYDLGNYPALVFHDEGGVEVQGELWAVDPPFFERLDEYEEAPELFVRRDVIVRNCFEPVQAYFYNRELPAGAVWGDRWPLPG